MPKIMHVHGLTHAVRHTQIWPNHSQIRALGHTRPNPCTCVSPYRLSHTNNGTPIPTPTRRYHQALAHILTCQANPRTLLPLTVTTTPQHSTATPLPFQPTHSTATNIIHYNPRTLLPQNVNHSNPQTLPPETLTTPTHALFCNKQYPLKTTHSTATNVNHSNSRTLLSHIYASEQMSYSQQEKTSIKEGKHCQIFR